MITEVESAVEGAISETLEWAKDRAQDNAPVDTGFLRDNIEVRIESSQSGSVVSQADYSIFVEFGTEKMEAQPFLRPAIVGFEEELKRNIEKRL